MSLRDIRVRKRLHELDRAKASYPTVARTGDIRRIGKDRLTFDDTNTIIFMTGTMVTYPTTLPVGSKYFQFDLKSSIESSITGNVNPGAVDPWLVRGYEPDSWSAFKEDNLFEQAATVYTSAYYQTGSSLSAAGEGFASTLKSKTAIRIELPIVEKTMLNPLSASMVYYDFDDRKFKFTYQAGDNHVGEFGSNDNSLAPGENAIPPFPNSRLFFNHLGKHSTNLADTGYYTSVPPAALPNFFFDAAFSDNFNQSTTNAATSQSLSMENIINQPFLLEKCVVKIPFLAGAGWFEDKTHFLWTGYGDFDPYWYIDSGGPAVTFAMFNQLANNQKDLIVSGTIIPERDDIRQWEKTDSYYNAPLAATPSSTSSFPQGFRSFSLPSVVVPAPEDLQFTSSLTLEMTPFVSIGITAMDRLAGIYPNFYKVPVPFVQSLAGRNKNLGVSNLTGRSIFGKTATPPSIADLIFKSINEDLRISSGTAEDVERFYQIEKHTESPYLIFPKDKLFFSISKLRSTFVSESFTAYGQPNPDPDYITRGYGTPSLIPAGGGVTDVWIYQSRSHDVGINTGTLSITLYGSLIKEGKEYHDTLNPRLNTEQIHETIGMDPVLDEFDVFYEQELSGTLMNRFKVATEIPYLGLNSLFRVTQSFFDAPTYSHVSSRTSTESVSTQYRFLEAKQLSELRRTQRNQTIVGTELFWDCRIPDPRQAFRICNPPMTLFSQQGFSFYYSEFGKESISGVGDWPMSFPYEPKFSTVDSLFSNNLKKAFWTEPGSFAGLRSFSYEQLQITVLFYTASSQIFSERFDPNVASYGLPLSEWLKIVYGFGAGRANSINTFPTARLGENGSDRRFGIDIRGWRHGLYSAFPTYTKATFRRTRYGQIRDMLEQRIDTKFFSDVGTSVGALDGPVQVKFVNSDGETVDPLETVSSNLSFEATSSYPYFDGEVKNREEPITFANVNQSIVVI